MRIRGIPLWLNIILIGFAALLIVAGIFALIATICWACSGGDWVQHLSTVWYTIFPWFKPATEEVVEVVPEIVETVEEVAAARLII